MCLDAGIVFWIPLGLAMVLDRIALKMRQITGQPESSHDNF